MSSAAPPAPEPSAPAPSGGVWGALTREVAGMPLFMWVAVGVVGLGIVFLMRRNGGSAGTAAAPGDSTAITDPSTGLPYGNPLASAIDPTTGLPYAFEQFPVGGVNSPTGITAPYQNLLFGDIFGAGATESFPTGVGGAEYVTVTQFPTPGSTLASIAAAIGIPLATLRSLNPNITDPSQIVPGSQIRIK